MYFQKNRYRRTSGRAGSRQAQRREGHGQPENEKQGKDKSRLNAVCPVAAGDDAHEERNHGQDAGIRSRRGAAQEDRHDPARDCAG